KNATATIPIIFSFAGDPVGAGLVASFARPGGNPHRCRHYDGRADTQAARAAVRTGSEGPRIRALMVNPNSPDTAPIQNVREGARVRGMRFHVLEAGNESEIDAAFAPLVELHVHALVVGNDPFFWSLRDRFVMLADRHAVPASYFSREFAEAGGLISYAPNLA